jgi:hypothetical protein
MVEQIKNPGLTTVESKKISDDAAEKRIEQIADKAAQKASHTEKAYDENHQIFSK